MKKELRGKKTSNYLLRCVPDIENIITSHRFDKEMDEDAKALNNEFGFDISTASNIEDCSDAIKRNILGMYNDDITPSVMFLYSFICWFQRSSKVLNIKGHFEKRTKLLDFGVVLNQETIDSVRASFAMEGLEMTQEDERRGEEILTGERSVDDVIAEISLKYVRVS